MRRLSSLGAIFFLSTLLAACGATALNGKFTARNDQDIIDMDFNPDAKLVTLTNGEDETVSEYTIEKGLLYFNNIPTYNIVETDSNTFELYKIGKDGNPSEDVTFTLTKK
ncbi:hypothetical protein KZO01_19990 [Kurthia zopfii]|uniref:Lipoprotein n=1 Tax=Kurthia zopfii TaxID=1650 RepID=A0A8B4Q8T5_9BACL|nr:hypothetical protein [Kurthia zopfii]PWI22509.1 hypothetical protein DF281_06740 [Kurthia zopfii]TDR38639.1 hypothetical protein DFR61_11514 [Kurthia zopfii]GEK31690.1 hypothetical protein KZO01_19990 [Kurthia zopfii]STX08754.1 Uncharacterised protein [Kurthia zopfii]